MNLLVGGLKTCKILAPVFRIEGSIAVRAPVVTSQEGLDGEFRATGSAEQGSCIVVEFPPNFDFVPRECVMTLHARIVGATALETKSKHIEGRGGMFAPSLVVDVEPNNFNGLSNRC